MDTTTKEARIHYFSATGNTARAVGIVKDRLEKTGYSVSIRTIGTARPLAETPAPEDIFAFPTLGFSAPVMVKTYIRRMPRANGKKAAVLCVNAGGPAQAIRQVERMLTRRGYRVTLTASAPYAVNWSQVVNPADAEDSRGKNEAGDAIALGFAEKYFAGNEEHHRPSLGTQLWSGFVAFSFGTLGRRLLGKGFIADTRCTRCGFCAETCPAGTILMNGTDGRPRWRANCQNCNRCINLCPQAAIQNSTLRMRCHTTAVIVVTAGTVAAGIAAGHAAEELPWYISIPAVAAAVTASFLIGMVLEFTLFDTALGWFQAKFPRPFGQSATASFRRYKEPGFVPSRREE